MSKFTQAEYWISLLGGLVAIGVIAADFPINDTAETIVGVIAGALALSDTLGIGRRLGGGDAETSQ